ncbi:MAG TPA: hypothetical protein DDZ83_01520 [Nitrospinae bacterium]|nr:hypothetical protein [Nitrospinota bacterium]
MKENFVKICLYSDIHAQLAPLDAIQEAVDKENPDRVVVVGDLVMLGPEPAEVVERFMGRRDVDVLAGNLDWWVSKRKDETDPPPRTSTMSGSTKWSKRPVIGLSGNRSTISTD